MPTGSRNARKPGIRLERRWLSIMFPAPKTDALSSAVLIQLDKLVLTSREILNNQSLHHLRENANLFSGT